MVNIWIIIAISAIIISAFNIVPQIFKSYKTKSTKDLSYGMLFVIAIGNLLWIVYGIHLKDWAIIIANILVISSVIILGFMKNRYDQR